VIFFRDTALSDAIGFRYNHFADNSAAVEDFVRALESTCLNRLTGDDDRVLTIALDGKNAWGDYPHDGRPFLHALYDRLATDPRLKTVTFAEYVGGNPSRGIAPHPAASLPRVYSLATGSWVDETGSAPGVDLGTWIGEPEENAAWRLLSARAVLTGRAGVGAGTPEAEALLAAEGSDWFWWLGADHDRATTPISRICFAGIFAPCIAPPEPRPRPRSTNRSSAGQSSGRSRVRLPRSGAPIRSPFAPLSGPPRISRRRRRTAGPDRFCRGECSLRSASVPGDAWPIRAGGRAAGVPVSLRTSRLQP
jgi:hypothetical protein